ncbi:MAG: 16S rRNA (guanine(966)-N(2))-methyltransferase RsmD [Deltaproteobacteria bacterium]|nr:16S rRNA (guanine(966)-N(2))-methyltransferase RsmD [Deltaproteobacteria bacterium]
MRVIGGIWKGRRLSSFRGLSVRPTSDKVREAVFNILPGDFPFKKVLDLFAGTGAMGIEALSRGAEEIVFVDSDPAAISIIRKNLDSLGYAGAGVLKRDAVSAVRTFSKKGERFGLIFIDPPYSSGLVAQTLKAIDEEGIAEAGGIIVAEASKRAPVSGEFKNLRQFDERRYGDTLIYFFTAD